MFLSPSYIPRTYTGSMEEKVFEEKLYPLVTHSLPEQTYVNLAVRF
jgi:hypothetical protein